MFLFIPCILYLAQWHLMSHEKIQNHPQRHTCQLESEEVWVKENYGEKNITQNNLTNTAVGRIYESKRDKINFFRTIVTLKVKHDKIKSQLFFLNIYAFYHQYSASSCTKNIRIEFWLCIFYQYCCSTTYSSAYGMCSKLEGFTQKSKQKINTVT